MNARLSRPSSRWLQIHGSSQHERNFIAGERGPNLFLKLDRVFLGGIGQCLCIGLLEALDLGL